jgi:small conductance mechanosensitive channel
MDLQAFTLESIYAWLIDFLPKLGVALLIVFIGYLLSRWASKAVKKALEVRKIDTELIVLFEMTTRWGILILALYLAAESIAPGSLTGFVAALGIAGFALGFALQDVAKNFIAGILLLLQQPFNIGEVIEVADYRGTVLNISLRTTEMRTLDGRFVSIPNGDVFVNPLINFSKAPRRRVEITVGVGYESDLDQVTKIALETVGNIPDVLKDPAPTVVFTGLGDSAINFSLFYWVDTENGDLSKAQTMGIKLIKRTFEGAGIEMPYPTQSLHIIKE